MSTTSSGSSPEPLNNDILTEIFSHLRLTADPNSTHQEDHEDHIRLQTLRSISLVSRTCHELVEANLHHTLDLRLPPPQKWRGDRGNGRAHERLRQFLQRLLQSPRLGKFVRSVAVQACHLECRANKDETVLLETRDQYVNAFSGLGLGPELLNRMREKTEIGARDSELALLLAVCPWVKQFSIVTYVRDKINHGHPLHTTGAVSLLAGRAESLRREQRPTTQGSGEVPGSDPLIKAFLKRVETVAIKERMLEPFAQMPLPGQYDGSCFTRFNSYDGLGTYMHTDEKLLQLPGLATLEVDRFSIMETLRWEIRSTHEMPNLRELCLTHCNLSAGELKTFLAGCPRLSKLILEWVGLHAFWGLSRFLSFISHLSELKSLSLAPGTDFGHYQWIEQSLDLFGDASVAGFKVLPSLQELEIAHHLVLEDFFDKNGGIVAAQGGWPGYLSGIVPTGLKSLRISGYDDIGVYPDPLSQAVWYLLGDPCFTELSSVKIDSTSYHYVAGALSVPPGWKSHAARGTVSVERDGTGVVWTWGLPLERSETMEGSRLQDLSEN